MDSFTYKAKLEHWSRIVAECSRRDPGLTKNEWIRQNHISRDRFFYWQRKVREKALAEFPLSRASAPSVPSPSPAPEGCFDITSCLQQLPAESETGAEPQAASAPPRLSGAVPERRAGTDDRDGRLSDLRRKLRKGADAPHRPEGPRRCLATAEDSRKSSSSAALRTSGAGRTASPPWSS